MNPAEPSTKPAPALLSSKSTIFAKVPPDLRRQIDQALINRDPHTYKGVFAKFDLPNYKVSWGSFYRYGRQVRFEAAVQDRANADALPTAALTETAMRLACTHFIQLGMDASPKHPGVRVWTSAYRGAMWAHLAHQMQAAKVKAAEEAARSKVVENALDMCAKLAEDGCIEIHPPDESSPDARPSYVIRTAENAHRAEREAEQIDLQPNRAPAPNCGAGIPACDPSPGSDAARSEPACPHAGSPSASPRHDPEPLPHQPRREPFRETAHQRKPSQSPATQSEPSSPHAGSLSASPRHDPEPAPAQPCGAGISACDSSTSSESLRTAQPTAASLTHNEDSETQIHQPPRPETQRTHPTREQSERSSPEACPQPGRRGDRRVASPYDRALADCRQRVALYNADVVAGRIKPAPDPYQEAVKECSRLNAAFARRLALAQQAQATALANGTTPPYIDKRGKPVNHHVLALRVARDSWLANRDPNDCDATRAANVSRNSPSTEPTASAPDPDPPTPGAQSRPSVPSSDDEFRPESTNPFVDW